MIVKISPEKIPYSKKIQELCKNPWKNHPNGCPNYNNRECCPPNQPMIYEILDFEKNVYLIYTEFDVKSFAERMWKKHPDWTAKQAYNPRYWQPKARKYQREKEEKAKKEKNIEIIDTLPEAHGVNVDRLFRNIGIELEWPPRKITRIASLGGFKK